MTVSTSSGWAIVAELVDRFEDARRETLERSLEEFLPPAGHPLYKEVLIELVRVDLEYHWQSGIKKNLASYRQNVPSLFDDATLLESIAYEEYRQRRLAGEQVAPAEFAEQYGVDTEGWPEVACDSAGLETSSTLPQHTVYPQPTDHFAGFQLVEEIGRGAFSRVYLAKQDDLARRQVVLKVTGSRSLEPQHLARLQHTNIVPIYSIHEVADLYAICMPYFGDRTLGDLIKIVSQNESLPASGREFLETVGVKLDETIMMKSGKRATQDAGRTKIQDPKPSASAPAELSYVDSVLALIADVADGLSHAHQRGIVHRDVKPANILVTCDGRPMLLDFNLSDDRGIDDGRSRTAGGTLPYMGPEHLRAIQTGAAITPQSDIYSLGVILFELLAGQRPFADPQGKLDEAIAIMIDERLGKTPSVREHNSSIAPSVDAIIGKCLAPTLDNRYQTVSELQADLSRHADNLPLAYAPNPSIVERLNKWRRRHPRLVSAFSLTTAATLLVALSGLMLASQARQVARLEAESYYQEFVDQLPTIRPVLGLPDSDLELIRQGLLKGRATAALFSPKANEDWRKQDSVALLPPDSQQALGHSLTELHYLLARSEMILSKQADSTRVAQDHIERALTHNRHAISFTEAGSSSVALSEQRNSLLKLAGEQVIDQPVLQDNSTSDVDSYLAPQHLVASRQYGEARPKLDALRKAHPTDPVLWLLAGNTEAGLGRAFAAEGCYTTAIAMQPESYVAFYNRGMCRLELKDIEGALSDFNEVLNLQPKLQCGLLNRALAYEAAGRYDEAMKDLDLAMAKSGFPSRAYFLRARLRSRSRDYEGARADRAAGLAELPTDELSWVARGIARLKNEPKGALADFQAALKLNPNSSSALKNIVHVSADRLDKPDVALSALEQWLALDPNNPSARVGRAVLNARMGKREAALSGVEEALRLSQDPILLFQAACALSLTATDDNEDAARGLLLLSRSTEIDPRLLARAESDPDLAEIRKRPEYTELKKVRRELRLLQSSLKLVSSPVQ